MTKRAILLIWFSCYIAACHMPARIAPDDDGAALKAYLTFDFASVSGGRLKVSRLITQEALSAAYESDCYRTDEIMGSSRTSVLTCASDKTPLAEPIFMKLSIGCRATLLSVLGSSIEKVGIACAELADFLEGRKELGTGQLYGLNATDRLSFADSAKNTWFSAILEDGATEGTIKSIEQEYEQ